MNVLSSFTGLTTKLLGGVAVAAIAAFSFQTARISGVGCQPVAAGEKSHCLLTGLRQRLDDRSLDLAAALRQRDAEAAAHRRTKDDYRRAQADAEALETRRLALVRAQQEDANAAITATYDIRLAVLRARAGELRREAESARGGVAGAGGTGSMPDLRVAAGGAVAATGDPRLPLPSSAQLERDLIASQQAEQLDALITFVLSQHAIDPNAPEKP